MVDDSGEVDLKEHINILFKRKKIIISICVPVILISIIVNYFIIDPVYQASATIKLGNNLADYYAFPRKAKEELSSLSYWKKVNRELSLKLSSDELKKIRQEKLEIKQVNNDEDNIVKVSLNSKDLKEVELVLEKLIEIFREDNLIIFKQSQEPRRRKIKRFNEDIKELETRIKDHKVALKKIKEKHSSSIIRRIVLEDYISEKLNELERRKSALIKKRNKLENKLTNASLPKIIDSPHILDELVKPNRKINLVASILISLIVGIMAAYLAEFWRK